jgi:YD repeat-containing protein
VYQVVYPAINGVSAPHTVTYTYSVGGNPLVSSVMDSATSRTITTTVDLLGRTVAYTDARGITTVTTYDRAGRDVSDVTTAATGGGTSTIATAYLDDGRVSSVSLDGNVVAVPSYTTAGELSTVSYPTGTGDAGNGVSLSSITRDPQGDETAVGWTVPGSHSFGDTETLSQAGRVMTDTTTVDGATSAAWTYGYDTAGRLVSGVSAVVGSRPTLTYSYSYAGTGGCGADTGAGKDSARSSTTGRLGRGRRRRRRTAPTTPPA